MAETKMRWLGNGFYVGIPARDLSAEEVSRFGRDFLLSLGIYAEINPPKPKRAKEPQPQPEPEVAIESEPQPEVAEGDIEED